MPKLLEGLRHLFNPLHVACRLQDWGLSRATARRACAVWEWFYRRPRVALVALATALVLFCCQAARAGHARPEKHYQALWCAEAGGALETTPRPGLRVDCETADHAVEFDFAAKWAEAVGQSLAYAGATGKRAGIVLILERPGDSRFLDKLRFAIASGGLDIDVWAMGAGVEVGHGR
ncbi:hypothetical protein [Solidesulfovibrio magneticus]|uniref:Uncharacterized protein n=1 Tax=Solidesulfovibrio magneticus (strain ATCC 700980 / DSM 13731 / RS-1) TaxID=573370 RepID=C4XTK7_SOLM1|nr:hypothetical protein [Solidesulfovibrio magneticus]BAH76004.1 hypothetical protein DMR_25130 [Solidesulfovibrio magneticus RS-1]